MIVTLPTATLCRQRDANAARHLLCGPPDRANAVGQQYAGRHFMVCCLTGATVCYYQVADSVLLVGFRSVAHQMAVERPSSLRKNKESVKRHPRR